MPSVGLEEPDVFYVPLGMFLLAQESAMEVALSFSKAKPHVYLRFLEVRGHVQQSSYGDL